MCLGSGIPRRHLLLQLNSLLCTLALVGLLKRPGCSIRSGRFRSCFKPSHQSETPAPNRRRRFLSYYCLVCKEEKVGLGSGDGEQVEGGRRQGKTVVAESSGSRAGDAGRHEADAWVSSELGLCLPGQAEMVALAGQCLGDAAQLPPGKHSHCHGHLSCVPTMGHGPCSPRSPAGTNAVSGLSQVSCASVHSLDHKTLRLCRGITAAGNPLLSQALGSSQVCLRLLCPVVLLIT